MIFGARPYGNIITNGLVLNLDATNPQSYPGTGNTWFDRSGYNNNGTLTNGPTYLQERGRGSIVFDGVDDYATVNIPKSFFTQISISVTFKLLSFSDIKGLLQFANTLNDTGPWILLRTYGANSISWYVNGSYNIFHTVLINNYYTITLTYNGTTWNSYKNGILEGSYTGGAGSYSGNFFWLGNGYNGYTNTQISNVQIYNRALSAQEVLQNYNALKSRFV